MFVPGVPATQLSAVMADLELLLAHIDFIALGLHGFGNLPDFRMQICHLILLELLASAADAADLLGTRRKRGLPASCVLMRQP